jgi:hypothetical protein
LTFTEGVVYIWCDWLLAICGQWSLNLLFIAQLELLFLFSPITPFWTAELIFKLEWYSILLSLALTFPTYFMPIFHYIPFISHTESIFSSWLRYGAAANAGIVSVFSLWEVLYLLYKICRHKQQTNNTLKLRMGPILRFAAIYVCIELIDITGVTVYILYYDLIFRFIAFEVLHLRVVLLVYVFLQLRNITFIKNEIFTISASTKKSKSIQLMPTMSSVGNVKRILSISFMQRTPGISSSIVNPLGKSEEEVTLEKSQLDIIQLASIKSQPKVLI